MNIFERLQTPDNEYIDLIISFLPHEKAVCISKKYLEFVDMSYISFIRPFTSSVLVESLIQNDKKIPEDIFNKKFIVLSDENILKLINDKSVFYKHAMDYCIYHNKYHLCKKVSRITNNNHTNECLKELFSNKDLYDKYRRDINFKEHTFYRYINDSWEHVFPEYDSFLGNYIYTFIGPNFINYLRNVGNTNQIYIQMYRLLYAQRHTPSQIDCIFYILEKSWPKGHFRKCIHEFLFDFIKTCVGGDKIFRNIDSKYILKAHYLCAKKRNIFYADDLIKYIRHK